MDINQELNSEEYKKELKRLQTMKLCVLHATLFCYYDSARDGVSDKENFFLRIIDDINQSVVSIEVLAKEGMINTCLRELRYLLELSIKSYFIVANNNENSFEEQVDKYEKILDDSKINPINTLNFRFFDDKNNEEFKSFAKRSYGYLCKYVHSSSHQILERLDRYKRGTTIGFEGIEELKKLNETVEKIYSIVLVFMFHSTADYVTEDYLVEKYGLSNKWYFSSSKYISLIDENFDYKFERQNKIAEIKKERIRRVRF